VPCRRRQDLDGLENLTICGNGQLVPTRNIADNRLFIARLPDNTTSFDDFAIDEDTGCVFAAVHPGMVEWIFIWMDEGTSARLVFRISVAFVAFGRCSTGRAGSCSSRAGAVVDFATVTETPSRADVPS
jgi:hypothetical protein